MAVVAAAIIGIFVFQWFRDPYEVTALDDPSIVWIFCAAIVAAWLILYLPHIFVEKVLPDGKIKTALLKRRD